MKSILKGAVLALTISGSAAFAQTTQPDASQAPSAQNSGAGIAGQPGNKNSPAAKAGETTGTASSPTNSTVQQQDTSKIKGMPGGKSGPPAKAEDRR